MTSPSTDDLKRLLEVLTNAQSPNPDVRKSSEQTLSGLSNNLGPFLLSLATLLASALKDGNNNNPAPLLLAALQIKGNISGTGHSTLQVSSQQQSTTISAQKRARYLAIPSNQRSEIKRQLAFCLTQKTLPSLSRSLAQATASIAVIELTTAPPQWPNAINDIVNLSQTPSATIVTTLGYICDAQELVEDNLGTEAINTILNTVATAFSSAEGPSDELQIASVNALLNIVDFASDNFTRQNERDVIMSMIGRCMGSANEQVKEKGFECIVRVASSYYSVLQSYMPDLYKVTFEAIQNSSEEVSMQAIEFWTTLAEEELYVKTHNNFLQSAYKELVPLLLTSLTRLRTAEDDSIQTTRTLTTSAALCLSTLTPLLGQNLLPLILPYVEKHINDENPILREASLTAFGSILDFTQKDQTLTNAVQAAFETVLSKSLVQYEANVSVRETGAWACGQMCRSQVDVVLSKLEVLVKGLVLGLRDVPRVRRHVCYAIHGLVVSLHGAHEVSKIDALFEPMVGALLEAVNASGAENADVEVLEAVAANGYEAINALVMFVSGAGVNSVHKLMQEILRRISISLGENGGERLRIYLCGTLQTCITRLSTNVNLLEEKLVDGIMELNVKLLQKNNELCTSDCYLVIAAVANTIESRFRRYITHIIPLIIKGLKNRDEPFVNLAAVGCLNDILRAISDNPGSSQEILPYIPEIMSTLYENLSSEELSRDVKPGALGTLGEVALCLGTHFQPYLAETMNILFAAAKTAGGFNHAEDEELRAYLQGLRESVLEAVTGVFQGVGTEGGLLQGYVGGSLELVAAIAIEVSNGVDVGDGVVKASVGLLGDLGGMFGEEVKRRVQGARTQVEPLLTRCGQGDSQAQKTAQWARKMCGLTN
eukprot:augustus_masked-scaffold_45-processed-gene-1.126-mRNA-1 protein AED:1.00 eAED:1.00 QI:0/-1/0/0/-1/1/1/0/883